MLDKDQYGATLEISRTVWDGGISGAKRKGIHAKTEVEKQDVEVNLYAIHERVNQTNARPNRKLKTGRMTVTDLMHESK